jgi:hypothetical protein
MELVILYILFILSILPSSVLFVTPIGSLSFYALQVLFLIILLIHSYKLNNKIILSKYWIVLLFSILFSVSGYILYAENFSIPALYSFFSLIILTINASLFFSDSNKISTKVINKFTIHFHFFIIAFLLIGIFQYFGYFSFTSARAEYFTQSGTKLISNTRSTSIFIEPSAWAIYYAIYLIFLYPKFKLISLFVALLSMILSYSTTGILLVICILFYIFFNKKYFWHILISITLFLISGIYYLQSLDNPIINKIFFNSTDYRNLAPQTVFFKMLQNRPETILFGNGIFSLMDFTEKLGLSEKGQTTSNFFVDIFFELGLFAFSIIFIFLIKSVNRNYKLLLILLLLISQCGYRSYQYLFIIFIINNISASIYKNEI